MTDDTNLIKQLDDGGSFSKDRPNHRIIEESILMAASDKIEGLEADLEVAVRMIFCLGKTEWVKLNYPKLFERWTIEG